MSLRHFRRARLREWALWCLIFSLPLQGMSGVVAQWLGAQHVHREIVSVANGHHHHRHQHAHDAVERHHHALTDTTVVAVGSDAGNGEADSGPVTGAGSAAIAGSGPKPWPLRAGLSHARPRTAAWSVVSCDVQRLDKPPDACQFAVAG